MKSFTFSEKTAKLIKENPLDPQLLTVKQRIEDYMRKPTEKCLTVEAESSPDVNNSVDSDTSMLNLKPPNLRRRTADG